ncbi:MAG: UV damage repair endonuclease UvsE [Legionellales bacterium]|nr:UV damage repair endonuclease UvsE [Legionellales bacterium]|tara:strand:+ start:1000 stop:1932 length:933 start_codon:yes stop_codon:yes gene_type:complete
MNYGYACINMTLSDVPKSKRVTTNRTMIKRTFKEKGIKYASELALQNVKDLIKILSWNEKNNIKFYRMSSDIFPWCSEYNYHDMPHYREIAYWLRYAGDHASDWGHRLTFHPGPFCCLASPKNDVVEKTYKELNNHSRIFDMMGFEPSHYNKINIHVGGTYGDKDKTAERFIENFNRPGGLDENTKKRFTLENDDKASMWSTKDIYEKIYHKTRIPIVFDYHHHRFCTGGLTEREALKLAASTWPAGINPVVHVSESRAIEQGDPKIRPQAHSDFIERKVDSYGEHHDVMLECKKKELALLRLRKMHEAT